MHTTPSKLLLAVFSVLTPGWLFASGDHVKTESVTIWTDRGELFMEYQQPVVGKPARLTAHLTELERFRAVVKASVTVRLRKGGTGTAVEATAAEPARPGIFQPILNFTEAGDYSGEVAVTGEDLQETFALENVHVLTPDEHPPHEEEEAAGSEVVSFLKEQQWKIPFRTVLASRRTLVHSIPALGEVTDKPGHSAQVASPIDGRIVSEPPTVGQRVEKGQLVAEIAPLHSPDAARPELEREVVQAEAELALARKTFSRAEELVSQGAMPAKEVLAARTQVTVAQARLDAAKQQRQTFVASQQTGGVSPAAQHFHILAPIGGDIVEVDFTRDSLVSREKTLVKIDDLSRVWIEVRVFEPDLPAAREATGAVFRFPGFPKSFGLEELDGKIVRIGHHLEVASRTAPIDFEIANPKEAFPIGGFVEAAILTAQSGSYLALPVEALMEEGNRAVVFVHTSGEEFEKREVTTGLRDRGYVAITQGVKPGERVVTTGAYEIKLSTISGAIPEHGHAH